MQEWYAKVFGGVIGRRDSVARPGNWIETDDLPGVNLSIAPSDNAPRAHQGPGFHRSRRIRGEEPRTRSAKKLEVAGHQARRRGPRASQNSKTLKVACSSPTPGAHGIELNDQRLASEAFRLRPWERCCHAASGVSSNWASMFPTSGSMQAEQGESAAATVATGLPRSWPVGRRLLNRVWLNLVAAGKKLLVDGLPVNRESSRAFGKSMAACTRHRNERNNGTEKGGLLLTGWDSLHTNPRAWNCRGLQPRPSGHLLGITLGHTLGFSRQAVTFEE